MKFRKFDEEHAEGILPDLMENMDKTKSNKDVAFSRPLLLESETPKSERMIPEWNAFGADSTMEAIDENKALGLDWPQLSSQTATNLLELPQKKSKPIKIPQLKANRYDDIRHIRAKEVLFEVRKANAVDAFGQSLADGPEDQAIDPSKTSDSSNDISKEFDDWTPFDSTFVEQIVEEHNSETSEGKIWESFASMPKVPEGSISPIASDIVPIKATKGTLSSSLALEEFGMPATLSMQNLLELPANTAGENAPETNETPPVSNDHRPSVATDECSDVFSLGLDTVDDVLREKSKKTKPKTDSKNRRSLHFERKELLSPATAPTPKEILVGCKASNFDKKSMERQLQLSMDKIAEEDEFLEQSQKENASLHRSALHEQGKVMVVKLKKDRAKVSRRDSSVPTDVNVVARNSAFLLTRQRIKQQRSIHFQRKKLSPGTTNNSLLDTDDETSDSVSGFYSTAASRDIEEVGQVGIIVDTMSFNSGSVSTMTYPVNMKRSVDSGDTSKNHLDSCSRKYDSEDENLTSRYPRKSQSKPLGASALEIKMLNTFLRAAGPKIRSSYLSTEDREEIHNRAIEAGLPEEFINKILDQTAGIIRWEEQSLGTLQTSESTVVSSPSKRSLYSTDSCSTRYTKDTESISYFSYSKSGRTPKESDKGLYGCFGDLASTFWAETGLAGDDMMENVAAAISESFDDASWQRLRRRRRRRTVR